MDTGDGLILGDSNPGSTAGGRNQGSGHLLVAHPIFQGIMSVSGGLLKVTGQGWS